MKQKTNVRLLKFLLDPLIKKCANCSMCREECPTYMVKQNESFLQGVVYGYYGHSPNAIMLSIKIFKPPWHSAPHANNAKIDAPFRWNMSKFSKNLRKEMASSLASWIW